MRSILLASFSFVLVGCGLVLDTSPPDPDSSDDDPPVATDCTKDEECDDGIACTVDRCLRATDAGGPHGCYAVPHDDACPQPTSTSVCARYVCAPQATWDSSGCAVAPLPSACDATHRCDLETFACVALPTSCDECDDGNPCNGVESCGSDANAVCTRTSPGCGGSNDSCERVVCDTRSDVHSCLTLRKPALACAVATP